eukprot:146488-Pyramimonas_sp.AAC.1
MFKKQQCKRTVGPLEAGFVWDLQQSAPSIGGSMGTDDDPIDMDFGGFKFSLARMQLAARFSTKPRGREGDMASLADT